MKKACLATLILVLSFFVRSALAQSFTTPPQTVPYYHSGSDTTYTWIMQAQLDSVNSYVFYCKDTASDPTIDFNSSATFYVRFGGTFAWSEANYCLLLSTANSGTSWDSVGVSGYWYFSYSEYTAFSQFRSHREIKYNGYPYDDYNNTNYSLSGINKGYTIVAGASFAGGPIPPYFSFPIADNTAWSAPVTSVMDNDTLGSGAVYGAGRNATVTLFNGETGTAAAGCLCYDTPSNWACSSSTWSTCDVPGYKKPNNESWTFTGTINYSGAHAFYDAHPGYDYGFAADTVIRAPAGGTLCVAISTPTTQQTPSAIWRDTTHCPLSAAPGTASVNWTSKHVFYILHGPKFVNGSTDEYMTVFLHSNNLAADILSSIYQNGYATVSRAQDVATVGNQGTTSAHLHIEFYKKNSTNGWDRVDPYGNGTSNILW